MIKILILLSLVSCIYEPIKPQFKIGDCAGGGDWKQESGADSNFGNDIYLKFFDVSLLYNHYVFSINEKKTNKYLGSVTQKFSIQDKLLKISCPVY